MDHRRGMDRRWLLTIGVVLSGAAATYAWMDGDVSWHRDQGYERYLRRWLPVAAEFRARHLNRARMMIRLARSAGKVGLVSSATERDLEARMVRQVRFESRPVYVSGRRGAWGDTGIRWRVPE